MSSARPINEPTPTAALADASAIMQAAERFWERIESWLEWAGDWLNPILVKETRQALKSRQFLLTFLLVLIACWIVTMGGVALIGPGIYYSASGSTLLLCYFIVLAFPLTIVVPYSAFRSLAAEREDNTFDVLSITTLKPRQIISGKLGSAIAQMAVYFSAVTPCLAFTYLLRGVDVPTIGVLLIYVFFGSLGLSMIGLFLATLTRQRYSQVFVSVLFIAGLLGAFMSACGLATEVIGMSYMFVSDVWFWIGTLMGGIWAYETYHLDFAMFMLVMAGLYWFAMGTMLTGERSEMSQRVKRGLPSTAIGRLFFTWLNPGPASGYMFVVANSTALVAILFIAVVVHSFIGTRGRGWPNGWEAICPTLVGWGYLIAFLGAGRLVIAALRRFTIVNMPAAVLIQLLLVLAGCGIPA
jgi:ABC-type transport system involved in cytochrome c biogenesis permease component